MESSGISIPTNQDKIWVYWLLIVNTNTLRFSNLPLIVRHQHCFRCVSAVLMLLLLVTKEKFNSQSNSFFEAILHMSSHELG